MSLPPAGVTRQTLRRVCYPKGMTRVNGPMEMTNENGNHNDLPYNDPAFKWAWEI